MYSIKIRWCWCIHRSVIIAANGNGYMTKWLMGLVGAVLLFGLTSFINNIMSRLHELESKVSELSVVDAIAKESLRQLEELARFAKVDQIERAVKFNDITNKLTVVDSKLGIVTTRLDNYFGGGSGWGSGKQHSEERIP